MSAIQDAMHAFYANTPQYLMEQGVLFAQDHIELAIAGGATHRFGVTVGDIPAVFRSMSLNSTATNTILEIFEGGTYTAGGASPYTRLNRASGNTALPFSDTKDDVTISVAGLSVRKHQMWSAPTDQSVFNENDILVLAPNTVYYVAITNNDGGARDYDLTIIASIKQ